MYLTADQEAEIKEIKNENNKELLLYQDVFENHSLDVCFKVGLLKNSLLNTANIDSIDKNKLPYVKEFLIKELKDDGYFEHMSIYYFDTGAPLTYEMLKENVEKHYSKAKLTSEESNLFYTVLSYLYDVPENSTDKRIDTEEILYIIACYFRFFPRKEKLNKLLFELEKTPEYILADIAEKTNFIEKHTATGKYRLIGRGVINPLIGYILNKIESGEYRIANTARFIDNYVFDVNGKSIKNLRAKYIKI